MAFRHYDGVPKLYVPMVWLAVDGTPRVGNPHASRVNSYPAYLVIMVYTNLLFQPHSVSTLLFLAKCELFPPYRPASSCIYLEEFSSGSSRVKHSPRVKGKQLPQYMLYVRFQRTLLLFGYICTCGSLYLLQKWGTPTNTCIAELLVTLHLPCKCYAYPSSKRSTSKSHLLYLPCKCYAHPSSPRGATTWSCIYINASGKLHPPCK